MRLKCKYINIYNISIPLNAYNVILVGTYKQNSDFKILELFFSKKISKLESVENNVRSCGLILILNLLFF